MRLEHVGERPIAMTLDGPRPDTAIAGLVDRFCKLRDSGCSPLVLDHGARLTASSIAAQAAAFAERETVATLIGSVGPSRDETFRALFVGDEYSWPDATYINACLIHVLDFDDTHFPTVAHIGPGVVGAALAYTGANDCTSEQFLTAVAVGADIAITYANLVGPSHHGRGFHVSATAGQVGSAAVACMLLDLGAPSVAVAFSTAMAGTGGLIAGLGALTNPFWIGTAAMSGVRSALFAARGGTATDLMLEGRKGVLHAMSSETVDSDADTAAIEERVASCVTAQPFFLFEELGLKRIPTGVAMHAPVELSIEFRNSSSLPLEEIAEVEVVVCDLADAWRIMPPPPQSVTEARFDFRHVVATALTFSQLTNEALHASISGDEAAAITDLKERVAIAADSSLTFSGCRMSIRDAEGTTVWRGEVAAHKGSPESPLDWADLRSKLAYGLALAPDSDALKRGTIHDILKGSESAESDS